MSSPSSNPGPSKQYSRFRFDVMPRQDRTPVVFAFADGQEVTLSIPATLDLDRTISMLVHLIIVLCTAGAADKPEWSIHLDANDTITEAAEVFLPRTRDHYRRALRIARTLTHAPVVAVASGDPRDAGEEHNPLDLAQTYGISPGAAVHLINLERRWSEPHFASLKGELAGWIDPFLAHYARYQREKRYGCTVEVPAADTLAFMVGRWCRKDDADDESPLPFDERYLTARQGRTIRAMQSLLRGEQGDKIERAVELFIRLGWQWQERQLMLRELLVWTGTLSHFARGAGPKRDRFAAAMNYLDGRLAHTVGDYRRACQKLSLSVDQYAQLGERAHMLTATVQLALVKRDSGDIEQARKLLHESSKLARGRDLENNPHVRDNNPAAYAFVLNTLGLLARDSGDFRSAMRYHRWSLFIRRRLGDKRDEAASLIDVGVAAHYLGRHTQAEGCFKDSLYLLRRLNNRVLVSFGLDGLALVIRANGEPERAAWLLGKAQALRDELGTRRPAPDAHLYNNSSPLRLTKSWREGYATALKDVLSVVLTK